MIATLSNCVFSRPSNGSQSAQQNVGQTAPARELSRTVASNDSASEPSSSGHSSKSDRELVEALVNSKIYRDYERAFGEVTGLPVALRPVESWDLAHHGRRKESPFCALMAHKNRSCAACLEVQEKLLQAARNVPSTTVCYAGLSETAVPVRLGDRLIGFLQTGQVFLEEPTEHQFQQTVELLADRGVDLEGNELRKAFFGTRVIPGRQHASAVQLLRIFAQELSMLCNRILIQRENAESPVIAKAQAFIREHHSEKLCLGQVAKIANASPFYFCKIFKRATGMNFTDYLSSIRLEHSKDLLRDTQLRVSDIAFEVGFRSLNQFNRVFKRTLGQSPTWYRSQSKGRGQPIKAWEANKL